MLRTHFNHSVKVPRLYKVASTVAKAHKEGLGSIKHLVFEKKKKHPNIKAIFSLVYTLFKKLDELERLLKRTQFFVKESRCDEWLAKILIVELLWGKGALPGNSKPEETIRAYEQIFKAHLSDEKEASDTEQQDISKPRYVRINTLKTTLEQAVENFQNEGWALLDHLDKNDYDGFIEKVNSLDEHSFLVDIHIPNLLVFPPKTEFHCHPAYKKGSIILQDKASCLPVHILNPPPGSIVLDMCASPGMKTTHLAAVLNDNGKLYAVERNPRRFEILLNIVESSGARCVEAINADVLTCFGESFKHFQEVEYIIVDPSCSGSGMTTRHEPLKVDAQRLKQLAGFQIKILRNALTRYSKAKRVVYSTCSILPEENEDVVRQVLETNYNFKLVPAIQFVGDGWKNFGSPDFGDIGKFCLYAKPNEDRTNGFFVAVFEKLKEGEENQFFNNRIYNFKKKLQYAERRKEQRNMKKGLCDKEDNEELLRSQEENNHSVGRQENLHIKEQTEILSEKRKPKTKRKREEKEKQETEISNQGEVIQNQGHNGDVNINTHIEPDDQKIKRTSKRIQKESLEIQRKEHQVDIGPESNYDGKNNKINKNIKGTNNKGILMYDDSLTEIQNDDPVMKKKKKSKHSVEYEANIYKEEKGKSINAIQSEGNIIKERKQKKHDVEFKVDLGELEKEKLEEKKKKKRQYSEEHNESIYAEIKKKTNCNEEIVNNKDGVKNNSNAKFGITKKKKKKQEIDTEVINTKEIVINENVELGEQIYNKEKHKHRKKIKNDESIIEIVNDFEDKIFDQKKKSKKKNTDNKSTIDNIETLKKRKKRKEVIEGINNDQYDVIEVIELDDSTDNIIFKTEKKKKLKKRN